MFKQNVMEVVFGQSKKKDSRHSSGKKVKKPLST